MSRIGLDSGKTTETCSEMIQIAGAKPKVLLAKMAFRNAKTRVAIYDVLCNSHHDVLVVATCFPAWFNQGSQFRFWNERFGFLKANEKLDHSKGAIDIFNDKTVGTLEKSPGRWNFCVT